MNEYLASLIFQHLNRGHDFGNRHLHVFSADESGIRGKHTIKIKGDYRGWLWGHSRNSIPNWPRRGILREL